MIPNTSPKASMFQMWSGFWPARLAVRAASQVPRMAPPTMKTPYQFSVKGPNWKMTGFMCTLLNIRWNSVRKYMADGRNHQSGSPATAGRAGAGMGLP